MTAQNVIVNGRIAAVPGANNNIDSSYFPLLIQDVISCPRKQECYLQDYISKYSGITPVLVWLWHPNLDQLVPFWYGLKGSQDHEMAPEDQNETRKKESENRRALERAQRIVRGW